MTFCGKLYQVAIQAQAPEELYSNNQRATL